MDFATLDGTEPDLIMDILETELKFIEEQHQMAQEAVGVMAVQSGDNPRIVEHKLSVFIAPKFRPSAPAPQAPLPARTAAKEAPEGTPPSPPKEQPTESATSASSQTREEEASPSPPEKQPAESAPRAPAPRTGEEEAKLEIEQVDVMLRLVREALERHAVDAERMMLIDQMIDRVVEEKLVMISLFSLLGGEIGEEVLAALEKEAPQLVDQVRSQGGWFDFDDLARLNDRDTQRLLREVDQKHLVIALLMASDEVKGKMLKNMSERVRSYIRQEMEEKSQVPESEVRGAQGRIILQAIQLQRQGMISGVGSPHA